MAGERKFVYMADMSLKDQEKCEECSFRSKNSPRYCLVTRLQAALEEEISPEQIVKRVRSIITENVPHDCPIRY